MSTLKCSGWSVYDKGIGVVNNHYEAFILLKEIESLFSVEDKETNSNDLTNLLEEDSGDLTKTLREIIYHGDDISGSDSDSSSASSIRQSINIYITIPGNDIIESKTLIRRIELELSKNIRKFRSSIG